MKRQAKSSGGVSFSASVMRELQTAYRTLDRTTRRHPWLVQGSLNVVAPQSPSASVTYTWTRKVRAKTITVALSKKQAVAFRRAIGANRRVEQTLSRLREVSQTALLSILPGVSKRRLDRSGNQGTRIIPKGA